MSLAIRGDELLLVTDTGISPVAVIPPALISRVGENLQRYHGIEVAGRRVLACAMSGDTNAAGEALEALATALGLPVEEKAETDMDQPAP